MRKPGFYWIRFRLTSPALQLAHAAGWRPGEYTPIEKDGSYSSMSWTVVGSDCIYREDELEVGEEIVRCES